LQFVWPLRRAVRDLVIVPGRDVNGVGKRIDDGRAAPDCGATEQVGAGPLIWDHEGLPKHASSLRIDRGQAASKRAARVSGVGQRKSAWLERGELAIGATGLAPKRRFPLPTHCPGPRPRASYRVAFRPDRERRLRAATATTTAIFELFLRRRRQRPQQGSNLRPWLQEAARSRGVAISYRTETIQVLRRGHGSGGVSALLISTSLPSMHSMALRRSSASKSA